MMAFVERLSRKIGLGIADFVEQKQARPLTLLYLYGTGKKHPIFVGTRRDWY